jgi:AcrR family transcriptional regulator
MSKLNAKIKNIKRDLILDEALLMFEEYGYEELKISELAKKVGVSVGTIYSYFKSKEHLYGACVEKEIDKAYIAHQELFSLDISDEEKIQKAIELKFEIMSKKRTSLTSGLLNNPFFFESHHMEHTNKINDIYELFIDSVNRLKNVDIDSYQLVYILNSITNSYVLRWAEDKIESLTSKSQEVYSVFMSILKGSK